MQKCDIGDKERTHLEEQTMSLILRHQSEFPLNVRNEIQAATTVDPPLSCHQFCERIRLYLGRRLLCVPQKETNYDDSGATGRVLKGLDSEVDTEEEVEQLFVYFHPSSNWKPQIWEPFISWSSQSFVF